MKGLLRTQASSSLACLCMALGTMVSPLLFLAASAFAWPRARRGHADDIMLAAGGLLLFLVMTGYGIGKDLALRDNAASSAQAACVPACNTASR